MDEYRGVEPMSADDLPDIDIDTDTVCTGDCSDCPNPTCESNQMWDAALASSCRTCMYGRNFDCYLRRDTDPVSCPDFEKVSL